MKSLNEQLFVKKIMKRLFYLFFTLFVLAFCACKKENVKYKIGISQLGDTDAWRKEMKENIDRELVFYPEMEAIYKQADYNSQKQVEQIRELLAEKIDVLIVSPYEAQPLTAVIEEAYKNGVKIVTVDRNINSDAYNSYISADNYEVGLIAGTYAANYLNQTGNIVEITGLPTSTPAKERERGFADAINAYPKLKIQKIINGNWLADGVEKELTPVLNELQNVQLIFAHNDVTAKTASEICRKAGINHIQFIGVDALPGTGPKWIEDKTLLASVLYPNGGAEAIRTAHQLLNNENVPRKNLLKTIMVDSSNIVMLQQQISKINSQQKNIVRQQQLIEKQTKTFNTQRNLIIFLLASLSLLVALAGLLLYLRKKIVAANKILQVQNDEITAQSNQIIEMADKARQANEEKLNFFTNISHEIKTPLTLIIAPTEEALANPKLSESTKAQFSIVKRNAGKLLLLVNQLMDFRKIELNKMNLRVTETDLVLLLNDVIDTFSGFAKQHNIDCRLITKESQLKTWVDAEKMEKVFFNIISNAIKFTSDFGFVYITLEKDKAKKEAVIQVQDSGRGMGEDEKSQLFERFYSGEYAGNISGSGLGLTLSKEIIDLHHGNISVKSEKHKGSTFTIRLQLSKEHFNPDFLNSTHDQYKSRSADWIDGFSERENRKKKNFDEQQDAKLKEHTLLIIEDNEDLRDFLSQRFVHSYNILTAHDGAEGIIMVFENMPDIIICDVVLPKKDGIELTRYLKNDIRTEHIPVILLTAKTSEESKLEGIKAKADAYITKPFNIEIVEETMLSLLENRTKLKDHFTAEIPKEITGGTAKKSDKVFLKTLSAIIEKNISNEDFSIDDICREMSMSKIQLYRKAKIALDISINDYILKMRMQRAKHYLQNEDLSVSEIAYKTGFSTPSYFSTAFKKITNETPTAYKERFK